MYSTKKLREVLGEAMRTAAGTGWRVNYGVEPTDAPRFIVFSMQELPAMDGRKQFELEVNTVGPLSDSDAVETTSDAIEKALDHNFFITDDLAVYLFHSTRNRIAGSDPHTVRFRHTFDSYLYERT